MGRVKSCQSCYCCNCCWFGERRKSYWTSDPDETGSAV